MKTKKIIVPKRITAKWLRSIGACPWGREVFARAFPKGCGVTAANIRKFETINYLYGTGWLRWLIRRVLTSEEFYYVDDAPEDDFARLVAKFLKLHQRKPRRA